VSLDVARIRRNLIAYGGEVGDRKGQQIVKALDAVLRVVIRKSGRAPIECINPDCRKVRPYGSDDCPYCGAAEETESAISTSDEVVVPPGMSLVEAYVLDIERLGRSSMRALYAVGRRLNDIQNKEIWKADPTVEVADFSEWIEARTGWSYSTAQRLMRVARMYSSDQIERTTRIRIAGLLEIEKVMRAVPPERRQEAASRAVERAESEGRTDVSSAADIARDVRAEIIGDEEADVVEHHESDEVVPEIVDVAPQTSVPKSRKFTVQYDHQKVPGAISVGDVFRAPLPMGVLEVRLGADGVECYFYERG
jgi:hypothetical protein